MRTDGSTLDALRARRWWQAGRRVGSLPRAAAFVEDVGFALLFPSADLPLPSLWEAAADRNRPAVGLEWGADAERVWGWKDELPRRRLAWYGRFLRGRPSLLSPTLLHDLYPHAGEPDDFVEAPLAPEARRIAEFLLVEGPTSAAGLRVAFGVDGARARGRFDRALTELGRGLVVTHFGTDQQGGGWPSAVLDLTARVFPIPRGRDIEAGRLRATRRFLETMVEARAQDLGTAFGWRAAPALEMVEALVARGEAVRDGPVYRAGLAGRAGSREGVRAGT